jgi:hypothetical protein
MSDWRPGELRRISDHSGSSSGKPLATVGRRWRMSSHSQAGRGDIALDRCLGDACVGVRRIPASRDCDPRAESLHTRFVGSGVNRSRCGLAGLSHSDRRRLVRISGAIVTRGVVGAAAHTLTVAGGGVGFDSSAPDFSGVSGVRTNVARCAVICICSVRSRCLTRACATAESRSDHRRRPAGPGRCSPVHRGISGPLRRWAFVVLKMTSKNGRNG